MRGNGRFCPLFHGQSHENGKEPKDKRERPDHCHEDNGAHGRHVINKETQQDDTGHNHANHKEVF